MGNTSLKRMMSKFVLQGFLFTFFLGVLLLVGLNSFAFSSLLYPASYPETLLPDLAEKVGQNSLKEADIPDFYQYELWENETLTADTIPERFASYTKKAKNTGKAQTASVIMPHFFVYYLGKKQSLLLSYQLVGDFKSPVLRKYLPKGELLFWLFFFIVWCIGFFILIRRVVVKLQKELAKVTRGNQEIQHLNLESLTEKSNIKEVQEVLVSLSQMKEALSLSLQDQWRSQQREKQLIQSVTHDIRTPITITQGNLELLSETDLSVEQQHLLDSAANGVNRLHQYVEQLKQISGLMKINHTKQQITTDIVADWVTFIVSIASEKNVSVSILRKDISLLKLAAEQVTQALQNLITNSIDAVPLTDGKITVSFVDTQEMYEITVRDNGSGFSQEALKKCTERFYSTKESVRSGHYGLGLATVKEVTENNSGTLHVENIYDHQQVIGAKVSLRFWKS